MSQPESQLFTIEIFSGAQGPIPADLKAFRSAIYTKEMGYLTDETLVNSDDELGAHVIIRLRATNQVVASGHVYPGEKGEFADFSGADTKNLQQGVNITRVMVDSDFRGRGLIKLVLYLCCQKGRFWGRKRMFCFTKDNEKPTWNVLHYDRIPSLKPRRIVGTNNTIHEFLPGTQRLDLAITRCWEQMPDDLRALLVEQKILSGEAIETTNQLIDEFFTNKFFDKVYSGSIKKHHYLWTLGGFHQFVKMTTRVIALAVSHSEDEALRRHFLHHLSGEVDHEKQIETDLRTLGGDLGFVQKSMLASPAIHKFMALQEAALGFRADPLTYLAIPFGIEGFTAHLPQRFIDSLHDAIRTWGVKHPERATTFLRAHIVSDGGDDGHWQANMKIVDRCVTSEPVLQRFLIALHNTFDAMNEIYEDFVAEPDFTVRADQEITSKSTMGAMTNDSSHPSI